MEEIYVGQTFSSNYVKEPSISDGTGCVKFIYSKKATKFCEIFTLLLSYVVPVKSKVKISQNFAAFSEYMNFIVKTKMSLCDETNHFVVTFR